MQRKLYLLVSLILIIGLVTYFQANQESSDPIAKSWDFYQSQHKLLRPRAFQETPKGLENIRAETCGKCHVEIYQEWKASTHARAWLDDAQYQEELHKHKHEHGQDTAWICVNCHTPLMNQLEELVVGLENNDLGRPLKVANPKYDKRFQHEAISCATCHVKDGYILGVYGNTLAPHPVKVAPILQSEQLCTECHQAQAYFSKAAIACVFNTEGEWQQSQHSKQGKTCQSCHMPEVTRPLAWSNLPPRKTRRHFFGGSLIAKRPIDQKDMNAMKPYYNEGLELTVDQSKFAKSREISITLHNKNAGHYLPTGDPERYFEISVQLTTNTGQVLFEQLSRIGTTYQWSPLKKLTDNRIAPGEKRLLKFSLPIFSKLSLPDANTLKVRISKFRISEDNLKYHNLTGKVVPGYDMYLESASIDRETAAH